MNRPRPAKPSKSEIKKCEDQIILLEESLTKHNEELASASQAGNGDQIRKLIALIDEEQKQLDALFERSVLDKK
jgi:hypothetical protein